MTIEAVHTKNIPTLQLSDVSETGLLTLYCRAKESLSDEPILKDEKAVEITRALNPLLAESGSKVLRDLAAGRLKPMLVVHIALRARQYDLYAREFLARCPDGVIVNLGCGLDSRYLRLGGDPSLGGDPGARDKPGADDNTGYAQSHFFDLDLPEVMRVRERFYQDSERYHQLRFSVFDYRWMDAVLAYGQRPTLFLAEGLFMYLEPEKVKDLLLALQKRFPGAELAAEMVHQRWVSGFLGSMTRFKMQRELSLGKGTAYSFGIDGSRELESWGPGIEFLDEWTYFDTHHPKLGWRGWYENIPAFRQVQWTARYRLNAAFNPTAGAGKYA